jgi:hypothetical protein
MINQPAPPPHTKHGGSYTLIEAHARYSIYKWQGDGDGGMAIECNRCGRFSHHPEDVAQGYCGYCHRFHKEAK